eukprot:5596699-Pleurochrysis_carterae.AAC.3
MCVRACTRVCARVRVSLRGRLLAPGITSVSSEERRRAPVASQCTRSAASAVGLSGLQRMSTRRSESSNCRLHGVETWLGGALWREAGGAAACVQRMSLWRYDALDFAQQQERHYLLIESCWAECAGDSLKSNTRQRLSAFEEERCRNDADDACCDRALTCAAPP